MIGEVERDIEQLESTVFSGAVAPTERIYFLRREVTNFYRAVHPLLAVVATIERSVPEQLLPYLHDVHDNLALVAGPRGVRARVPRPGRGVRRHDGHRAERDPFP